MSPPPRQTPPRAARIVLRLTLRGEAYETITGDLEEEFADVIRRLGDRAARRWFWQQTWTSIWSRRPRTARAIGAGPPLADRRGSKMLSLMHDILYGARLLRRNPGFALTVACTLALGIAATTTVFGLINALVLHPLPYKDPGRVAFLLGWDARRDQMRFNIRYADAVDLRARTEAFEDVAVYRWWSANLSGGGLPERVQAYRVSANTFDLLGVAAAVGRTFTPDDAVPGADRVVVLSYGLWIRRFGADPALVGHTIVLDGADYVVIGVMPRRFEFPVFNFKGDLWAPLAPTAAWTPPVRADSPSVVAIGRLAPGATVASAQAGATALMHRLAVDLPAVYAGRDIHVIPMGRLGTEQAGPAFAVIAVAVALLLLIACANVANLLLARSLARAREMAVRAALGAGRWRLVRQLLVESALMALGGGVLGALLSWWALGALRRALPEFVVRVLPGVEAIAVDRATLGFAFLVSLATVVFFGLVPAWQAVKPALAGPLKADGRAGATAGRRRLGHALVIVEVAVAAALVVMTGLLARSARNLLAHDPGFDRNRVLALSVSLPAASYSTPAQREAFFDRLSERLGALPGVEKVGLVNTLPFSTSNETTLVRVDDGQPARERLPSAGYRLVNADYFEAMGIALDRGRGFTALDGRSGGPVAIVNRTFARRYLQTDDALGRKIQIGDSEDAMDSVVIVGVVGDVVHWQLSDSPSPEIYLPYAVDPRATMSVAVRTAGDPASLSNSVRAAVATLDPNQPAYDVAPMAEMVANSVVTQTLTSSMMSVFGVAALVLSSLGLYGVLAFLVGQRTKEIGVRVALGATGGDVRGLVLRKSCILVTLGLTFGLGLAAAGARGLSSLLFGVGPLDPVTYGGAAALLVLVGLAASYVPVRRALRVDPVVALRVE